MKKMNFLKLVLDLLMAVVFVLLFNKMAVAGLVFHEVAGLSIGLAFIIHIALNFKWVCQFTKKFFSTKINFKTRFGYIIDVLLLLDMGFIIISGLLISKVLFPGLGGGHSNLQMLHISLSYFALLLIGIHLGLHWNWVIKVSKQLFRIPEDKKLPKIAAGTLVVLLLIFGAYNLTSANYFSRMLPIRPVGTAGPGFNGNGPGGDMNRIPPNFGDRSNNDNGLGNREIPRDNNFKGGFPDRGQGNFPNRKGPQSSSTLSTMFDNLGIIALFSIMTFYIDKFINAKLRKSTTAENDDVESNSVEI